MDAPADRFQIRGLSPDGTEFVATSRVSPFSVWRVPVGGGSARRVADLVADDIAWSHDGNWFAYSQDNQLFLAKTDGTSPRRLMTVPDASEHIDHMRWSPDDRLIWFTLNGDVRRTLWEISTGGRNLRELHFTGSGHSVVCCGDWTPDGRYFVFRSDRDLWAIGEKADWWHRPNPDPVQLTFGPVYYNQPVISRDGKSMFAVGVQPAGELVRYDAVKKSFKPFLGGRSIGHLAYSRDGQWVAYVAYPEGTLWRARSDGADPLQLTFNPLQVLLPRWSADSTRIAFGAFQPGHLLTSFVISADGGNPEPFPQEQLYQCCPGWIPGENALTFSRAYGEADPAIYRFDLQSGKSEKVPRNEGLYDPIWSPDGRYTAAVDAPSDVLLLVDLKSGKRKQIAGPAQWPSWSPNSLYLYFIRLGVNWIFRVRVPDGKEEKFLEVPFRVSPWPFTLRPTDRSWSCASTANTISTPFRFPLHSRRAQACVSNALMVAGLTNAP